MNVLKKCCYRSLKENRKRTVVTIIGVILATALITGVACLAVSFRESMIVYERLTSGDFHYRFRGVAQENLKYFENNQQIEKLSMTEELGYAWLEGCQNPDKPYLFVTAIDERAKDALSLELIQGRMPETDAEIVIGSHIRTNGMVDLKVGDELTLQIGNRMDGDYKITQGTGYLYEEEEFVPLYEKTYTIVGIIKRPGGNVESYTAPGYSAFTRLEDPGKAEKLNLYASYTKWGLKHRNQVAAGLLGVSEDLYQRYYKLTGHVTEEEEARIKIVAEDVWENYGLLKWELMVFASGAMNMLYTMALIAVVIIILTSVFCIHNSFVISLTEKMKLYGRLSSVGTTSGQQRKIVYYEAAFIGGIGIPLGILCGVGASVILIKVVGGLVEEAAGFPLVFGTAPWAILLSVVLSALTVYLSASRSARRAARLSPISAIRANDTVRIRARELRCPRILGKLFGIGGRIAYKNLRRARVKYRTTVISIVVSVAVFIGMSTFVELLFDMSNIYNGQMPYQLRVSVTDYEDALKIAALEEVREAELVRSATLAADIDRVPYTETYREKYLPGEELRKSLDEEGINYDEVIWVRSLGEEGYARYCRQAGVSVEEAKDKAIIVADYRSEYRADGKIYVEEYKIAEYHKGDVIQCSGNDVDLSIEVLTQTSEKPMYLLDSDCNHVLMIVSEEWMDHLAELGAVYVPEGVTTSELVDLYIQCEDSDELEFVIRNEIMPLHYTITNYDAYYRADRSLYLVLAIFLYGFITVVALIGVTNIFNTITTNMELRAPEFAMLRSVGMTGKEFRRMIGLEGVFYGGKALLIGIPLGLVFSLLFNMALREGIVREFLFPWSGILTAVAAVIVLLFVIMRYSMAKINRKNIIETIQNENI